MIRAFEQLVRRGVNAHLAIAGEGPDEKALKQLVVDLKLDDRVQLLGFQKNTINLYEAMDIFALSSFREGLPNVVLESMSMSLPVVATRVAGVPLLVADGETGVLVDPGCQPSLTAELQGLCKSAVDRRKMALLVDNGSFNSTRSKLAWNKCDASTICSSMHQK